MYCTPSYCLSYFLFKIYMHNVQYNLNCPEIPSHNRLADELPSQLTTIIFDLMSAFTKGMPMPTDANSSPYSYMNEDHQSTTLCISQFKATTPPAKPWGFFKVVKSPAPGQNFSAKALPLGQKSTYPKEYFRRSTCSQHFLLISIKILQFWRNQTL